ncbi:rho guanine nucleotide exchange factor, putative, partial [Entamoeba invadens IP1]|uniref:rho guanine nucleotide exchange factor, putative n=1 Tax=Entamoeba invadens IP1 TaxID=370355 RepID=UPI0002C3F22A
MCSLEKIQATCRGYLMRTLYNKRSVLTRHNIVNEIYETELHFVLHLNMVISLFKVPVEDSGGRILPRLVAQTIFSNVEQVMSAACVNANKFQTAVDVWKYDSKFGGVMLQVLNNMVPLTEYTLRWDSLKRELKNAYKNNLFKTFVKVQCAPETTDNLSFEDLLITPVQRLMRYKSLLSELLKNTPPEHPDYIDTMKAVA